MRKIAQFLVVLGMCNVLYGEKYTDRKFIEKKLVELGHCQDEAIVGYIEDKCYINPDRISIATGGILLHTDFGGLLSLSGIASDYLGIYTTVSLRPDELGTVYPIIRCKNCNKPFSPTFINKGVCPHCGIQN
ncbi:MAG: hypothetical protein K2X08_03835 [Chlamydiales bacterium]|nr:hypothetical protein [Chlamydiales bacterium]